MTLVHAHVDSSIRSLVRDMLLANPEPYVFGGLYLAIDRKEHLEARKSARRKARVIEGAAFPSRGIRACRIGSSSHGPDHLPRHWTTRIWRLTWTSECCGTSRQITRPTA